MTSKLTREQLHERARENVKALKLASRQTAFESAREEILADLQLAELALAAINSDPVAYAWVSRSGKKHLTRCEPEQWRDAVIVTPLYSHAQPAPERDQVRSEHAEWSQATFGNVGPVGPLKHLSKEALEAAADPEDLSEWADMQFLLWDAQRRAGITDEQITQAMIEKLAVNKQREWPEPKDGEPRLHIKEQPASVVPDAYVRDEHGRMMLNGVCEPKIGFGTGWNACRATMLQASPVCTCPSGGGSLRWPCPVHAGSSPVIPDGYVLVPMRLTAENGAKGALSGEFSETRFVNCPECFGDDECETCDGSGKIEITAPVTWTTIKEIWAKGIEHFSATPREVKGE